MKRYLMTFLTAIMTLCCAGTVFPLPSSGNSHDIASLHAWGPYSKRFAGISHIPDMRKGIRFDFSVMPGYYRNRQLVPHVLFESSYYPWEINPVFPLQFIAVSDAGHLRIYFPRIVG